MGWDAAIFGKLTLEDLDGWRKAKVGSADVPDAAKHLSTLVHAPKPVKAILAELAKWTKANEWGFVDITVGKGEVAVAAFLPDDDYLDMNVPIASLWAAAAPFGGKGELSFMGILTASFGYQLTVGGGKVKVAKLAPAAVNKLDRRAEAKAIIKRVQQRMTALGIDAAGFDDDG